jgi:hypothetical protein
MIFFFLNVRTMFIKSPYSHHDLGGVGHIKVSIPMSSRLVEEQ